MNINIILSLCIALAAGLLITRLMKLIRLPNITGYLIVGIILGATKLLNFGTNGTVFKTLVDVALAFIAFSIGVEFKISSFKQIGGKIVVITLAQALTTALLVDAILLILAYTTDLIEPALAICLGAIATATAPAATLMVVRQYKAKGPVTRTLLPVVALDDAIGLIIFSVSLAIARAIHSNVAPSFITLALEPLLEIGFSLIVGAVIGLLLSLSMKLFKSRVNREILCILSVLLGCGLTMLMDEFSPVPLSQLLVCMMIGAVYCNLFKDSNVMMDILDRWTAPLFMLFFVLSGAELDVTSIASVGVVGIIYILVRSVGKYSGAFWGAAVVKSEKTVRNFLGLTLLPQAGVAIGMAALCEAAFVGSALSGKIMTIVLCATLVYEIFGPLITKIALIKAGEIEPHHKKSKHNDDHSSNNDNTGGGHTVEASHDTNIKTAPPATTISNES